MQGRWGVPGIVWQAIFFESGILLLAWLLASIFDLPGPYGIRITWPGLFWGVAATAPPLIAMIWSMRTSAPSIARLRAHVERDIVPLFDGCSPAHFALIAILAGLGEEALFRGVIQSGAAGILGTTGAIVVAGILFGLCHPITPLYASLAALIGIYLGALYAATGELLAPVLTHALYDFIALMTLVRARRDGAAGHRGAVQNDAQGEPALSGSDEPVPRP